MHPLLDLEKLRRAVEEAHKLAEEAVQQLKSDFSAWDVHCIFAGSRGSNSRLERHTLGSVSAAIANEAHCSVEVVRARRTPGVT